jgi:hypothetical protein
LIAPNQAAFPPLKLVACHQFSADRALRFFAKKNLLHLCQRLAHDAAGLARDEQMSDRARHGAGPKILPMKTTSFPCLLTVLAFTGARLAAEPASGDSAKSAPPVQQIPPAAYTDRGTTTVDVNTTTYNNYPYSNYSNYGGGFSGGISSFDSRVTVQHRPIYFPPAPPPLGEPDFARRMKLSLAKLSPPTALAQDVYEPFYAPLSTLLFTEDLSRKRRERLDAYHAGRSSLIAELRARLESVQNADPAAREASLAALAREQAPRLEALATTAEDMRNNFTEGGFFESSVDWNDTREWRLGDNTRWESQIDEIKVMRGAAAFQEALSPAQRLLLREMEMELADGLRGPTEEISLSSPGPFLYFSPATARIRLPVELPAELSAKISAYQAEKAALKKELHDVLYLQDRSFFEFKRINAIKALAEKQAARFVVVEQLAEEIRRGLAPLPNPARPPALPLSTNLSTRLFTYNQQKAALQNAFIAKQAEVKNALPDDRVEFTRVSDTFVLTVIPNRRSPAGLAEKRQAIVDALVPFNQQQTKLYAELAREKEVLRAEVMKAVNELGGHKSIDQLLREFAYAFKKQESWELYREYEIAVLEPGLSPAQRILLFGAALEKLDLPLAN